jgi:DNA modification methylase
MFGRSSFLREIFKSNLIKEQNHFYLPHLEYEGSIGFSWLKNIILAKKNFRLSRAGAVGKFCLDTNSVPMKAQKLKFWLP